MLNKLHIIGVIGLELDLFRSYLCARTQVTKIGNVLSNKSDAINYFGVPQGTILGPLLFSIFINDITSVTEHTKIVLYADDTSIFYSSKDIHQINLYLNHDLQKISNWLNDNKLQLNTTKSKSILIGSAQKLARCEHPNIDISVNDNCLEQVTTYKYNIIGVHIDCKLKWIEHIDHVAYSVSKTKRIGILNRLKNVLLIQTLNLIVKSLIFPQFDYCDLIWSNASKTLIQRLYVLLNRAGRTILKVPSRTSASAVRSELGWKTLQEKKTFTLIPWFLSV